GYYRLARTLQRLQKPELSQHYLEVALQKDPSLAPLSGGNDASNSAALALQRTAYQTPADQAPNVSAAPAAPAPSRVISLETSQTHQSPQQVLPPPPPAVNEEYQ
ncbi:MAG: hypothetical protein ACRELF_02135, partial [Gemmataceae bacterium]